MPAPTAKTVFDDYNTSGVPASGRKKVKKSEARAWGADLELRSGKFIFDTKALISAVDIPTEITSVETRGGASLGDGLAAVYVATNTGSSDTVTSLNGRVFYRSADVSEQRISPKFRNSLRERYGIRIYKKAPFLFPDYQTIVDANYPGSYIYPQGVAIDESANEILKIYSPTDGFSNKWGWVVVRDWTTLAYKYCFSIGEDNSQGVGVTYEGGVRYAWAKTAAHAVAKYSITPSPTNRSRLTPAATIPADLNFNMCIGGDVLVTEQYSVAKNVDRQGHVYQTRNLSGVRTGRLDVGFINSGTGGDLNDFLPKHQGIARGPGFYALGYGGYWKPGDAKKAYHYNGARVFDADGKKIDECFFDPEKLLAILNANGVTGNHVENEGVHVLNDGTILLAVVTSDRLQAAATTEGITLIEVFARGEGAIDASSAAVVPPGADLFKWQAGMVPLEGGKVYHPISGAEITTLQQLCALMRYAKLDFLSWNTTNFQPTDNGGDTLPTGIVAKLENQNNSNFYLHAVKAGFDKHWIFTTTSNPGDTQAQIHRPTFKAHKSGAAQTINAGSNQQITFGTEAFDTGSEFAGNAYTPAAGVHRMSFDCDIFGHAGGDTLIALIFKNGTQAGGARTVLAATGAGTQHLSVSLLDLSSGADVYTAWVSASGAGTRTVSGVVEYTSFSGEAV